MTKEDQIEKFLTNYDEKVFKLAGELRTLLMANLPGITEQLDLPARMVAYCYGQKYSELICVIIPSKKGLKLGFNKGPELPDPQGILEGIAKTNRFVDIKSEEILRSAELKAMIKEALKAYKLRSA